MTFAYDEPDRSGPEDELTDDFGECDMCSKRRDLIATLLPDGEAEVLVCRECRHDAFVATVTARAERLRRGAA